MLYTVVPNHHRGHATHQTLLHPSGERIAIETTAAPIRQADGAAMGCVLVFRDVSEKRQLIQEISWQIGHDALTGLHNRSHPVGRPAARSRA